MLLDVELAALYAVETRALVQAVKRNAGRFPKDFVFQLSHGEAAGMRSQSVISSKRGIKYQPLAFTEHGVAMLSSVLRSERAIQVNIMIVRAFVRMRELMAANRDIAARIEKLERNPFGCVAGRCEFSRPPKFYRDFPPRFNEDYR